jgi:hypothetical protein
MRKNKITPWILKLIGLVIFIVAVVLNPKSEYLTELGVLSGLFMSWGKELDTKL